MNARVVLVQLSEAVAGERLAQRARIVDFCEWALAAGERVEPDLIALILAARRESGTNDTDTWTRLGVYHCLWADLFNWCGARRVLVPEHIPETLWTYLHYLHDGRLFGPGSDPLRELLRALRCYGGLGPDGRPEPEGTQRRVRCVCTIPYQPKRRSEGA